MLPNGFELVIVAAIYPEIGRLFAIPQAGRVLRRLFRLIQGYCIGPAVAEANVAAGSNPPGLGGMQTEHPLDVSSRVPGIRTPSIANMTPASDKLQPVSSKPPVVGF